MSLNEKQFSSETIFQLPFFLSKTALKKMKLQKKNYSLPIIQALGFFFFIIDVNKILK